MSPSERLVPERLRGEHSHVPENELSAEDVRAIILTLMRIEEKLDELFGEDDDDGEEEDLA
jgi:hypothetical protein